MIRAKLKSPQDEKFERTLQEFEALRWIDYCSSDTHSTVIDEPVNDLYRREWGDFGAMSPCSSESSTERLNGLEVYLAARPRGGNGVVGASTPVWTRT